MLRKSCSSYNVRLLGNHGDYQILRLECNRAIQEEHIIDTNFADFGEGVVIAFLYGSNGRYDKTTFPTGVMEGSFL